MSTVTLTYLKEQQRVVRTMLRKSRVDESHWKQHDSVSTLRSFKPSGRRFSDNHKFKHVLADGSVAIYKLEKELDVGGSEGTAVLAHDPNNKLVFLKIRRIYPDEIPDVIKRSGDKKRIDEAKAEVRKRAREEAFVRARHEYKMSVLLDRIAGAKLNGSSAVPKICGKDSVCAVTFFVDPDTEDIVTVFPYEQDVEDLQTFLTKTGGFYDSWRASKESERNAYHAEILKLGVWLCTLIHMLNTYHIFHIDIKPENILVDSFYEQGSEVPRIFLHKLVDWGFGCAHRLHPVLVARLRQEAKLEFEEDLQRLPAEERAEAAKHPPTDEDIIGGLECARVDGKSRFFYHPDRHVRDPAAGPGDAYNPPTDPRYQFNSDQLLEFWPKFEMYSCAITLQYMCDPDQNFVELYLMKVRKQLEQDGRPVIRRAKRSPRGLTAILKEMTGPLGLRGDLAGKAMLMNDLLQALEKDGKSLDLKEEKGDDDDD